MIALKLKHKLLLLWLGSILLSLLLVGGLFSYLSTRFHTMNARHYIAQSFIDLREEFSIIEEKLTKNAALITEREDVIASMSLIDTYQNISQYQPLIFDAEKNKLSQLLKRQLQTSNLNLGFFYDSQLQINSFCWLFEKEDYCGYLSYQNNANPLLLSVETNQNLSPFPPALQQSQLVQSIEKPEFTLKTYGEGLLFILTQPVWRTLGQQQRRIGFLQLADKLNVTLIEQSLRQKEARFSFALSDDLLHGHIVLKNLSDYFKIAPDLEKIDFKTNHDWWQPNNDYFLGVTALDLPHAQRVIFIFTLDKSTLYTQITVMQQAVLVMLLFAGILLIPLGTLLLKHIISDPIEQLVSGVEALTAGEYLTVKHHKECELGILANSFNQMSSTLRQREEHLRKLSQAVEQSPVSILITDKEGIIEYVNKKFVSITGYTQQEILGKKPSILKSGFASEKQYDVLWQTITHGHEWQGEFYNRKKNGEFFWESALISPIKNNAGQITHYLGIKEDITVRKQYEEQLLHQANFDYLTNLPNRLFAFERLKLALSKSQEKGYLVAVLFIDLDQFKQVNDTLGHIVGDELLIAVSHRLSKCLKEHDTLARLGGDEFLVILPQLTHRNQAEVVAQQLMMVLSEPFHLSNRDIFIAASIGITLSPHDGTEPNTLLRNADAAMYWSKEDGRNTYHFFTPEINQQALKRLEIESQLRYALERGELSLHYQPQMNVKNQHVIGAEALLRWHNPVLGQVSPMQFIPIAETTGLINAIGAWALRTACHQAKLWQTQNRIQLRVAVNVSPYQFRNGHLLETVAQALEESNLAPDFLELELTESLLMSNAKEVKETLQDLKKLGIHLALDDFGTGYSSLSYLKYFPFDILKIDRAFIKDLTLKNEDASLTTAIIMMAHSLGLTVIAEGVETQEQLAFLHFQGCDCVQGYYLSQPLSAEQFIQFIQSRRFTKNGIRL